MNNEVAAKVNAFEALLERPCGRDAVITLAEAESCCEEILDAIQTVVHEAVSFAEEVQKLHAEHAADPDRQGRDESLTVGEIEVILERMLGPTSGSINFTDGKTLRMGWSSTTQTQVLPRGQGAGVALAVVLTIVLDKIARKKKTDRKVGECCECLKRRALSQNSTQITLSGRHRKRV